MGVAIKPTEWPGGDRNCLAGRGGNGKGGRALPVAPWLVFKVCEGPTPPCSLRSLSGGGPVLAVVADFLEPSPGR